MRTRPYFVFLAVSISLVATLLLTSCGGGSTSTKIQPSIPIFTSVPVTAAAQATPYSYTLAATDPAGGTVTYALTTSPTGATLSGSTISWTPAATQSRTSNSFTATATTSSGGSATQSWTVSPTGVVTVNWMLTYWEPAGPVQVPVVPAASLQVSAVVPQSDGSITVLKGATTGPGVVSIAGVPAGNYWLVMGGGGNPLIPPVLAAYWTNTSTFDAGRDVAGFPQPQLTSSNDTNFSFNLTGLESVNAATYVLFNPEIQSVDALLGDLPDSTTVSATIGYGSTIDWTQVSSAFLLQYAPSTLGPLSLEVMGSSAFVSNLSLTNGATNSISQNLQTGAPASLGLTVQGTEFAATLQNTAPSTPSSYASGLAVSVAPWVTGPAVTASGFISSSLTLAGTSPQAGIAFTIAPFVVCDLTGPVILNANTQPSILDDENLGTLQYPDSFPATWTRSETFCEEAIVPIAVPNSTATVNFALVTSTSAAPSSAPLAPLVGPVQNPTINNASLYTAATLTTTTPSFSWTAPAGATPYGYRIEAFVQETLNGLPYYAPAGSFYTSQTSVTLPPLSGGNSYVFCVTALVDGAANVQTAPLRSALPTGFASVVSAPMTISAGASTRTIHGDASIVKRLSQPQPQLKAPPRIVHH